ncbi:MAG TPA: signal peptidase I [Thermoanaerobaculia bacterium]|jgi:signal peptidase I|nr:signal peptidase I [Thermoanaerobaculia bacterium]
MAGERSIWREYAEALIIAAVFLAFTNTFVVQTFYIPSGSMEDTLLIGDHLFVNRFIYGPATFEIGKKLLPLRTVRRGDIVVFRSPQDPSKDLVKRAVGVGGDTIQLINQKLYVNDKEAGDASFALHKDPNGFNPQRDTYGPYLVPSGHVFCMGDNRDNSYDSRFWGPLPVHLLKGRALLVYWSYGGTTAAGPQSAREKAADLLETALGFFSKTRWARTLHLIR